MNNNIVDIDISSKKLKRVRFDADDERSVVIDPTDMNVLARLNESYPKLNEVAEKALHITDGIDESDDDASTLGKIGTIAEKLKEADAEIRGIIDYIFNAKICDVAIPNGTMFDIIGDTYAYDFLLTAMIQQYQESITEGYNKMLARVKTHTDKYTKKKG